MLLLLCTLFFTSCGDSFGKQKACELLFSDYSAEIDYTLTTVGSDTLSGKLLVTKGEKTKIEFSSSDSLSGMSVESDEGQTAGVITFSYYGIKIPLPDRFLSKLNLMFSVFSSELASELSVCGNECFSEAEGYENGSAVVCSFSNNSGSFRIVYDRISGTPIEFSVNSGDTEFTATVTKFKQAA